MTNVNTLYSLLIAVVGTATMFVGVAYLFGSVAFESAVVIMLINITFMIVASVEVMSDD